MSYLVTPGLSRARLRRRRPRALGGLIDDIVDTLAFGPSSIITNDEAIRAPLCVPVADEAVVSMDAQIAEFDQTWHPTGFYTPDDMQKVVLAALDYSSKASDQMTQALSAIDIRSSGHEQSAALFDKAHTQFSKVQQNSSVYAQAIANAKTQGSTAAINAPGLRPWVIALMKASRDLVRASAFIMCNRSQMEQAVNAVANFLSAAIDTIGAILGVIVQAGQKVISVAGDAFGFLGSLVKFLPYVLLAGGGYFVYKKIQERRGW